MKLSQTKYDSMNKEEQLKLAYVVKDLLEVLNSYNLKFTAQGIKALAKYGNYKALIQQALKAKDKLVLSNQRMIVKLVDQRYVGRGVERDELIQIGNVGLCTAIAKFNPEKDTKFSSYAYFWIIQALEDHFLKQEMITLPSAVKLAINQVYAGKKSLNDLDANTRYKILHHNYKVESSDTFESFEPEDEDLRSLVDTILDRLPELNRNFIISFFNLSDLNPLTPLELALQYGKNWDEFENLFKESLDLCKQIA